MRFVCVSCIPFSDRTEVFLYSPAGWVRRRGLAWR